MKLAINPFVAALGAWSEEGLRSKPVLPLKGGAWDRHVPVTGPGIRRGRGPVGALERTSKVSKRRLYRLISAITHRNRYAVCVDLAMMSPTELAAELGARIRRERLAQNLSQRTLASKAGISRLTVTRMEATGAATLTNVLSVLVALRRVDDLERVLLPRAAQTLDEFMGEAEPTRQRGRR